MKLNQVGPTVVCITFYLLPSVSLEVNAFDKGQRPTSSATPAINLVQNPGLERADAANSDLPANFVSGRIGKPDDVKLTWEDVGLTGKKAVAVETMHSSCIGYWQTTIAVKPETEYTISLYYKCRSLGPAATLGDPLYNTSRPGGPNLELGVASEDDSQMAKPSHWTDVGMALPPVGGAYLPLATEWSYYQQKVRTVAGQTKMRLKLRVYCYAQKVWFDDLGIVETDSLPKVVALSPKPEEVVKDGKPIFRWKGPGGEDTCLLEYSTSPMFSQDTTTRASVKGDRLGVKRPLKPGRWFWRMGFPDQEGTPCWLAARSFCVGEKPWSVHDTTPPVVNLPAPPPGMEGSDGVTIAAKWNDTGSGTNVASARILLDRKDVTREAKVADYGFTLKPTRRLSRGVHRVEATIGDKTGNMSNRLSWQFGIDAPAPMKRRFDGGVCLVNDEPYFPIGIYAYVCTPTDGRFKETALAQATAAGYDCLLNTTLSVESGDSVEDLDILSRHGMKCLLNLSADMQACDTPASAKVALIDKGQGQFRSHPCVLGYWGDDPENLDNTEDSPTPASTLTKIDHVRKVLKESSPDHPIVWAISNLPRLKDCVPSADVILSYRYPLPQFHPKMVFDWTLSYVYSVVGEKPVWFNSQGFDLGYGNQVGCPEPFRPTPEEMRAMAYYSLVAGVKGWTLYGCSLSEESQPQHWKEALRLASELRYLAPALAAGKAARSVSLQSDSTSGSIFFREIEHGGTHSLIAVNMSAGDIAANWNYQKAARVTVLFEDRIMTTKSRTMNDSFSPFEVHVYQW
ncbi:MAG: hypothetical protein HY318_15335 [Armatimonadetes bacterium]|nr:hypothetical protein [Armatimonadota bacterium]